MKSHMMSLHINCHSPDMYPDWFGREWDMVLICAACHPVRWTTIYLSERSLHITIAPQSPHGASADIWPDKDASTTVNPALDLFMNPCMQYRWRLAQFVCSSPEALCRNMNDEPIKLKSKHVHAQFEQARFPSEKWRWCYCFIPRILHLREAN